MRALVATPGVAGVDEAGRGAWAGPVVVAAVLLPEGFEPGSVRDSKQLSPQARESEARRIREQAEWKLVVMSHSEVDSRGVLAATLEAMAQALRQLLPEGGKAIVDGDRMPAWDGAIELAVRGDARYLAVAAASILAKTERDRLLVELHERHPLYGFAGHKGYGTAEHLQALRQHGPSPVHRRSFAPVREMLEQPCLTLGA